MPVKKSHTKVKKRMMTKKRAVRSAPKNHAVKKKIVQKIAKNAVRKNIFSNPLIKKGRHRTGLVHQKIAVLFARSLWRVVSLFVFIFLFLWIPRFFIINRPLIAEETVKAVIPVVATAYSSDVEQTDSTPCITADGFNVCEHGIEEVVAANFLPFGTRVRFPELGNTVYVVHDRMNAHYGRGRVDIWLKNRDKAVIFGAKKLTMEILEDKGDEVTDTGQSLARSGHESF